MAAVTHFRDKEVRLKESNEALKISAGYTLNRPETPAPSSNSLQGVNVSRTVFHEVQNQDLLPGSVLGWVYTCTHGPLTPGRKEHMTFISIVSNILTLYPCKQTFGPHNSHNNHFIIRRKNEILILPLKLCTL